MSEHRPDAPADTGDPVIDVAHAAGMAPPVVLLLPGWLNSGPAHWQTRWEARYGDVRVEQAEWERPLRGDWMARLDEVVADLPTGRGIALVAHSLGCHLVARWAGHSRHVARVRGALLVAPADIEREDAAPPLTRWRPILRHPLPFPSLAVISTDDPFAETPRALAMAAGWGARVLLAGPRGHLNGESGLGDWPEARLRLAELLAGRLSDETA